jgi:hypothetical protein
VAPERVAPSIAGTLIPVGSVPARIHRIYRLILAPLARLSLLIFASTRICCAGLFFRPYLITPVTP